MQKRVLPLFVFLLIMFIGFISAATFPLSDILDQIDSDTMTIVFIFIVSFTIIFFSLNKTIFKKDRAIAAVLALVSSFGITYGMNKLDLDIHNWFYNIGISEETLFILIPVLALALAIFLVIQLKGKSFLVFGGLLLVSSFFIEEAALVIVLGAVLLVFGFLSLSKGKDDPLTKAAKSIGNFFKK